jgi:hypothetical protein
VRNINTKKMLIIILILVIASGVIGAITCLKIYNKNEAKDLLTEYLNVLLKKDYDRAYSYLSQEDKKLISKELFVKWRETVKVGVKFTGFKINDNIDSFENYPYYGKTYEIVYGIKVNTKQNILINGFKTTDYDKDSFKIMIGKDKSGFKIMLYIEDLAARIKAYQDQLDKT